MLNYKKPIKVKSKLMENQQVTIAPADTKTQVIKAGNKTIGTVSNPTVANQLKTAIQKGEVNLAQDLKEEAPPDQEQWIKDNKDKFIKQYGKKGEAILYATAWQRHNKGVKESKELDLDKLFESVAFDEPDPVSHILSKFKFEVNQFCQGQQINPDLYDCLYDYYLDAGLMPYGVAKARDANPIEWVSSKLKEYLGQCGVSQQTAQPVESPVEAQNEQPVPEYGDDEQQVSSEPTEQEIDQMFESILGKPLTSKIKESMTTLNEASELKAKISELIKPVLKKYNLKGTISSPSSGLTETIVLKLKSGDLDFIGNYVNTFGAASSFNENSQRAVKYALKNQYLVVYKDYKSKFSGKVLAAINELYSALNTDNRDNSDVMRDYFDVGHYIDFRIGSDVAPYVCTGKKEPITDKASNRLDQVLESKIKESKMKVTQPKRKQVAESSIDRKSKLMEAVDPKSVYIVVKNVPRLKDIRCDIGITYDMRFDPDSKSFSALNLKLVDMETGQKYSQKQVMMDTLRKLMAIAQKDASDRAEKNDLFHDDFDEDGIPLPVVSGILKASKPVTFDYVRVAKSLAESSIDRKARQLVDSWNLKLKQKLKESTVTPKRKLREGVSISTSQSQGFGYDEIDGNTSINVCATGEDAVRLAEILRDAGFGQFKQSHIAVPQQAIVSDFHDDVGEVQQPEYDPMPEYDETQPEVETEHDDGEDESQLLDRIKQFVSYGAEAQVEEITEAEDMGDSEVVVYNGKLGIVVDADTGADNEYEVMFADGTEIIAGTDLEPATQAQINASKDIVKYIGDDAQFAGRYGVIIEEDGDEYHVAFSDGETWIVGSDLEAPALQESFANDYQMNEPAQTNYMTHGMSGGLNSLRRSQATGNVTRISTMESKGKCRKMLKESKQAVGKPSDELASMANLVEAISVQQRIKFGA